MLSILRSLVQEVNSARDLQEAPWISMGPILILFLTVLALNFAGDKLREYFDVREISL